MPTAAAYSYDAHPAVSAISSPPTPTGMQLPQHPPQHILGGAPQHLQQQWGQLEGGGVQYPYSNSRLPQQHVYDHYQNQDTQQQLAQQQQQLAQQQQLQVYLQQAAQLQASLGQPGWGQAQHQQQQHLYGGAHFHKAATHATAGGASQLATHSPAPPARLRSLHAHAIQWDGEMDGDPDDPDDEGPARTPVLPTAAGGLAVPGHDGYHVYPAWQGPGAAATAAAAAAAAPASWVQGHGAGEPAGRHHQLAEQQQQQQPGGAVTSSAAPQPTFMSDTGGPEPRGQAQRQPGATGPQLPPQPGMPLQSARTSTPPPVIKSAATSASAARRSNTLSYSVTAEQDQRLAAAVDRACRMGDVSDSLLAARLSQQGPWVSHVPECERLCVEVEDWVRNVCVLWQFQHSCSAQCRREP